jgi:two-component system KDP operon response regulator KdpE
MKSTQQSEAIILAVDDEPSILTSLGAHLQGRGYQIITAMSSNAALKRMEILFPDLIVLDLMLPDKDGLEVIREVRQRMRSEVPIIVLSAIGDEQKKVEAFELGADDYLTKPFGFEELLARVKVALRHSQRIKADIAESPEREVMASGGLMIDLYHHTVTKDNKEVKLTPKQYELLKFLIVNKDKLITHPVLLRQVWGSDYSMQTHYLHVFIRQLRQKIEPNPNHPIFIITEPGIGYRFRFPHTS